MRVVESPIEDRLARLTRRERACLGPVARYRRTKDLWAHLGVGALVWGAFQRDRHDPPPAPTGAYGE